VVGPLKDEDGQLVSDEELVCELVSYSMTTLVALRLYVRNFE
jgi:hypothetical protein